MDMYLLSRMLHYIENGDAKVFITYTGHAHSQFYKTFFSDFLPATLVTSYTSPKKCVEIPKELGFIPT